MKKISLYVHFPFCIKKCNYCDFNSSDSNIYLKKRYIKALIKHIDGFEPKENLGLRSIYFGGGTPTLFSNEDLKRVKDTIDRKFKVPDSCEFTIETNPNLSSKDKMQFLKDDLGVTKVSLGVQTFSNRLLNVLGRFSNRKKIFKSIENINRVNFSCNSLDMIFAIPNQSKKDLINDLDIIKEFKPKHLSYYSLIVEKETELKNQIEQGLLKPISNSVEYKMQEFIIDYLKNIGYKHYEISSYALEKKHFSRHNLTYWDNREYLGFGSGAHGFYNNIRYYSENSILNYIDRVESGKNVEYIDCKCDKEINISNHIMLGLRKLSGINIKKMNKRYEFDFMKKYENEIKKLLSYKLISIKNNHFKTTKRGFFLMNDILQEFV